jgi:hypothetical protein
VKTVIFIRGNNVVGLEAYSDQILVRMVNIVRKQGLLKMQGNIQIGFGKERNFMLTIWISLTYPNV